LNGNAKVLFHNIDSDPLIHLMVIEAAKRNILKTFLSKRGVPTLIQYPHPVHKVKAFSHLNHGKRTYPRAEHLAKSVLSLPFHSALSVNHINYIVESIREFYEKGI
jgi:dTDP-4-amino-4,6-dideoxygalactose transaminase